MLHQGWQIIHSNAAGNLRVNRSNVTASFGVNHTNATGSRRTNHSDTTTGRVESELVAVRRIRTQSLK